MKTKKAPARLRIGLSRSAIRRWTRCSKGWIATFVLRSASKTKTKLKIESNASKLAGASKKWNRRKKLNRLS